MGSLLLALVAAAFLLWVVAVLGYRAGGRRIGADLLAACRDDNDLRVMQGLSERASSEVSDG